MLEYDPCTDRDALEKRTDDRQAVATAIHGRVWHMYRVFGGCGYTFAVYSRNEVATLCEEWQDRRNEVVIAGWEPAGDSEMDIKTKSLGISPCDLDRTLRKVRTGDREIWPLVFERERNGSRSGSNIMNARAGRSLKGQGRELVSSVVWNENTAVYEEMKTPKATPAEDVGKRYTVAATLDSLGNLGSVGIGEWFCDSRREVRRIDA